MYISSPQDISRNKSKVALVTGGGQGIGTEITRSFITAGYQVALVDYNADLGVEQEKKLGSSAKFFHCDLSDEKQVAKLASNLQEHYRVLDTIVHNAKCPAKEKDLLQNLDKEWDPSFKVMLKHPILLNHLLLAHLKLSLNPSILFIGSTNSKFISQQPISYHVVKGALQQTVRYLACEYGNLNIRVNLLNPGIVDVPGRTKRNPALFQKIVETVIPLKRAASAEEIGNYCLFLASEQAKYITGSSLDLDGGEHLKDHFSLIMAQIQSNEPLIKSEVKS